MEEHRIIPMAYKVEMLDGEIVERELTPEEYEKEVKWANEVRDAFIPRRMPLEGPRKLTDAFK